MAFFYLNPCSRTRKYFATLAAITFTGAYSSSASISAKYVASSNIKNLKNQLNSSSKALSTLAENCGLDLSKLKNMLSFKILDKKTKGEVQCELVPLFDSKEQKECVVNLYSYARGDYMKFYWTNGRALISKESAEKFFSKLVRGNNQKNPKTICFAIKFNGNYVGLVDISNIHGFDGKVDAYVSYIIDETYSGRGIVNNCLATAMKFVKYLRKNGNECYKSLKRLRGLAKIENKASCAILKKNGFVKNEGKPTTNIPDDVNEYFYYFE